jgi:hypothetical protein
MNPDIQLMCEVPAAVNVYRAECAGLMMTDISSQKILRAIYIMAFSLTQNKQQGTLRY